MRIIIKTKSTGRVIRDFTGSFDFQVFIAFENFLKERIMAKDFSESAEYILVIRKS